MYYNFIVNPFIFICYYMPVMRFEDKVVKKQDNLFFISMKEKATYNVKKYNSSFEENIKAPWKLF